MAYIPDVNDITQPTDAVIAETAQAEFRAIKTYLKGLVAPLVTWNTNDKDADIALTGGNLIATKGVNTGVYSAVRATTGKSAGKWYWEVTVLTASGGINIGVATLLANLGIQLGASSLGWAYRSDGQKFNNNAASAYGATFTAGDVIGIALDSTVGTLQFYKNNALQGVAYNAGLAGVTVYPAMSLVTAADSALANFGSTAFVYTAPSGYTAFSSLNTTTSLPKSQTVLQGPSTGVLAAGAGLNVDLKATALAVYLAYAAGYTTAGALDYVESFTADIASYWAAVAASNTQYAYITRTGPAALTAGKTLAPPQYGYSYDRTKQSVLQFAGAPGSTTFLDDFGNTWTAQGGAKVQTNYFKFGTGALGGAGATNALNGAADFIKSTDFKTLGVNGWTMRAWVKPLNALPGVGNASTIFSAVNAASSGARLVIWNNGGTIRFSYFLSSDGATNNIGTFQGTTLPVLGTEYFVELTFDALAGVYRLYVNGAQEQSNASALRINGLTAIGIGADPNGVANTYMSGYIDKPEILPYCDHPAGTAYAVPTGAPSITAANYASDWYDIGQRLLKSPSAASAAAGTNPTFTSSSKLYVGDFDTNGAAVTAVRTYAYNGVFESAEQTIPAANTVLNLTTNMGVPELYQEIKTSLKFYITSNGWLPEDVNQAVTGDEAGATAATALGQATSIYGARILYNANLRVLPRTAGISVNYAGNPPTVARLILTARRMF